MCLTIHNSTLAKEESHTNSMQIEVSRKGFQWEGRSFRIFSRSGSCMTHLYSILSVTRSAQRIISINL